MYAPYQYTNIISVKVKVDFTLEQVTKAKREVEV